MLVLWFVVGFEDLTIKPKVAHVSVYVRKLYLMGVISNIVYTLAPIVVALGIGWYAGKTGKIILTTIYNIFIDDFHIPESYLPLSV